MDEEHRIISLLQELNKTMIDILGLLRFLAGEKMKKDKESRDARV